MQKQKDVRKGSVRRLRMLRQFGSRLRMLRQERDWTQAEMAHRLGLDRSYVGEIEQGKRNPCLLNLRVIADGLKISLAELFSGL